MKASKMTSYKRPNPERLLGFVTILLAFNISAVIPAIDHSHDLIFNHIPRVPPLYESLSLDARRRYFTPEESHFDRCRHDLGKFVFYRLLSEGSYATVFEVETPDYKLAIMKAQIFGVKHGLRTKCFSDLCQRRNGTNNTFLVPSEAFIGLALNDLKSKNFVRTMDFTVCDAIRPLEKSGMTREFNRYLKPQYDLLQAALKEKPAVLTMYLVQERVIPGLTLSRFLTSDDTLDQVTYMRNPLFFLKVILTQVFATLYKAQLKLNFVHFDLHMENVLVANLPTRSERRLIYEAGQHKFNFMSLGWMLKITDFGFASMRDPVTNRTINNMSNLNYHGFHELYDVRLFLLCFLHLFPSDMFLHIWGSTSKTEWRQFSDMLKYALGDELIQHYFKTDQIDFTAGAWIYQLMRIFKSRRELRREIDQVLMKQQRNGSDFLNKVLGFPFFDEMRANLKRVPLISRICSAVFC